MTIGRRIFYVARPFGMPLGGLTTLFRHVEILVRRGFDARIYLLPGDGTLFVDHSAPVFDARNSLDTRETDIFVIPEAWAGHLPELLSLPVQKYVFCQNHFYAFDGLGGAPDYASLGINGVIASSRVIARFLEAEFGLVDVPVIPYGIDTGLFRSREKRRQIAYMPRKLGLEAAVIRGLFRRRHPTHSDVSWVALDRLPIDTVAKSLGESRWFLSLSHLEGFGLPPIEAMAAEALVIGFHGEGGLEYASSENGLWCPTGDLVGCVAALARAIELADKGAERRYLAAGRATAERYSPAVQEEALVRFWGAVMSRPSHQLRHMAR